MPCRPLSALTGKGFLDGFDFGMYHRQFALKKDGRPKIRYSRPHFDPFFRSYFDSLEPDQFGHAAAVVHDGRETSFAPAPA